MAPAWREAGFLSWAWLRLGSNYRVQARVGLGINVRCLGSIHPALMYTFYIILLNILSIIVEYIFNIILLYILFISLSKILYITQLYILYNNLLESL